MVSAAPRDSATVVLVRETGNVAQALLVRRHADLAFAGGTWAFPGGKLEPADSAPDRTQVPRDADFAFLMAACRETFEETGILLARQASGDFCPVDTVESLQGLRPEVSRDPSRFAEMLAEHALVIDPSRLVYWARWITPAAATRRFDARFFVAHMPADQAVQCDSTEATELLWLDLDRQGGLPDESIVPAPPTRYTLADLAESLAEHGTLARLILAEAAREVPPIMPKGTRIDGRMTVLMPWDPAYYSVPGEGTPPDVVIPERYRRYPSRVVPSQGIPGLPSG